MPLTSDIDPDGYAIPSDVPPNPYRVSERPGKTPGTTLTVDMQLVNYRIAEWADGGDYEMLRHWCYADIVEAGLAMEIFLAEGTATEPVGWVRAWVRGQEFRRQSHQEAIAQLSKALQSHMSPAVEVGGDAPPD
jgi:hypothetical protein